MIGSEPENVGAPASTALRQVVVKDGTAFRTISEFAAELGIPQHILRYWETRFPQLRPLQRAGNRRYYRPADVALARRIHRLLEEEHYTIKGVQRLLAGKPAEPEVPAAVPPPADVPVAPTPQNQHAGIAPERLARVRTMLVEALAEPFVLGDTAVRASVSVGAVLSDGRTGADELITRADQAMYRAKQRQHATA